MEPNVKNALITVLQFLEKVRPAEVDRVLNDIDLSDDAWDEEVQVLKDLVKWNE